MLNEEKIEFLLRYLKELKELNEDTYQCHKEIKVVIEALNKELGL